jgi:hypothetical protein
MTFTLSDIKTFHADANHRAQYDGTCESCFLMAEVERLQQFRAEVDEWSKRMVVKIDRVQEQVEAIGDNLKGNTNHDAN